MLTELPQSDYYRHTKDGVPSALRLIAKPFSSSRVLPTRMTTVSWPYRQALPCTILLTVGRRSYYGHMDTCTTFAGPRCL